MTKRKKIWWQRVLIGLVTISILCSALMFCIVASAMDTAVHFALSNVSAVPGDTVSVTITLPENPGLVATLIKVHYDKSVLTLTGIKNGTVFDTSFFTCGNDLSVAPYTMMWEDSLSAENNTTTGTLATLIFKVAESAQPGAVPITLAVDAGSTYDVNLDDVPFTVQNGSVTVLGQEQPDGRLSISSTDAYPGKSIQVTISIDSNPGIVATLLRIKYDKAVLTLTSVENGTIFGASTFTQGNDLSAIPYVLLWEDSLSTTNCTATGTLATLTFTVNANAPAGETAITLIYDENSTFNNDLDNVSFEVTCGTVSVYRLKIVSSVTSMHIGNTVQLFAMYTNGQMNVENLTWDSSDSRIATVDVNGQVTAKAQGNVRITATDANGVSSVCYIQIFPTGSMLQIISFNGSFEQKVNWWKRYSSATMHLGFQAYGCDDAVRYVWSTDSGRVHIDQNGNITNIGFFARSAEVTLTAYDARDNVVASSSVTVQFYKFAWQYRHLQSQEAVSDNYYNPVVLQTESDSEMIGRFITVFCYLLLGFFWL